MDKSSYFIKDKALFGSFPTNNAVKELEQNGVCYFFDFTNNSENLEKYEISTSSEYYNYPIEDMKYPTNYQTFGKFIINISNTIRNLKESQKIYIHCRGGHGRAGVVVACLLCYIYKISPEYALELTNKFHSERKEMKQKWRRIGSPQTRSQKNFVMKFFKPIFFNKAYKTGNAVGLSNFSNHPVYIKEFNYTFPNSEIAFNAFKDPQNIEYIDKLKNISNPILARILGMKCNLRNDWDIIKKKIMYNILVEKVLQNKDVYNTLLYSGLRPLIYHTRNDKFWGYYDEIGQNILGNIWMKIREKYVLIN